MKGVAALLMMLLVTATAVAGASCDNDSTGNVTGHREMRVRVDTVPATDSLSRYTGLTDADFETVARELDVEIAAIKAVVLIEAGKQMKGFWAPGVPVVNFDRSMYNSHRHKAASKKGDKNAKVPAGLTGYALKEWTQLTNARRQNEDGANMGTFWGMFQIGGFNWRQCGTSGPKDFWRKMCTSERDQLELFAEFITRAGLLPHLKSKNWSAFARGYNGPSYAKRGYHTRLAAAYARYNK